MRAGCSPAADMPQLCVSRVPVSVSTTTSPWGREYRERSFPALGRDPVALPLLGALSGHAQAAVAASMPAPERAPAGAVEALLRTC